ncbi:MAG: NADH:flavin oxidoreductase [Nannocystaceae bacterium]|nr:NADH:flavin oxidoreductase [Nannocystaceae bacterium]
MKLFEPGTLGSLELPNRIVKSAMSEAVCTADGRVTDAMLRMYSRWARGGAGLLITGLAYVQPDGRENLSDLGVSDDIHIEGLRALAEAVHHHGSRIAVQLNHSGGQCFADRIESKPVGPSARRNWAMNVKCRALDEPEILRLITDFGDAAYRAQQAGIDAVQVHAAHGWLVNQFLTPRTNKRRDAWGGSTENRARFMLAIIAEIHRRCGPDYPVLVKLNIDDGGPLRGGIDLKLGIAYARLLDQAGVAALEVSGGTGESYFGLYTCRGDLPVEPSRRMLDKDGRLFAKALKPFIRPLRAAIHPKTRLVEHYWEHAATHVRAACSIPIMLVGGIRRRSEMERVLADGVADYISLGRPLVRQPGLPRLLAAGATDTDSEAQCVSCNRCLVEVGMGAPLKCHYKPQHHAASLRAV